MTDDIGPSKRPRTYGSHSSGEPAPKKKARTRKGKETGNSDSDSDFQML